MSRAQRNAYSLTLTMAVDFSGDLARILEHEPKMPDGLDENAQRDWAAGIRLARNDLIDLLVPTDTSPERWMVEHTPDQADLNAVVDFAAGRGPASHLDLDDLLRAGEGDSDDPTAAARSGMAELSIEQRVLMLEATIRSLRTSVADLHATLADQTTATQDLTAATDGLMASVREGQAITQRHTQHVRAIEALFLECLQRLSAGNDVDDLHDELRRFLEEHGADG